ncbi:galactose mutarotase [Bacillus sp. FJAT-27225]|uniref:aldose epimerase family protein n=1 Tax=Bacillus sp. FJAT-27225 TaxID=1743144 RepID=UPI00080C3089|nr:aldose epimerase family protein [Bacillus sp. FJAT-27225]OCA83023.1 galactose mutarotase [Bacillus sp. FJAT-27225]
MEITKRVFGEIDGQAVHAYTITNSNGMKVTCLDYGCIVSELYVPDSQGNAENVVLGFHSVEEYAEHSPYFGSIVGRVAGRITKGRFTLDGKDYQLAQNDGENHLHGGFKGLDRVVWKAEPQNNGENVQLVFTYDSPDGEENYPGAVSFRVVYTFTENNEWILEYFATTDQKTIVNLTNHSYFNLSGNFKTTVLEHTLQIDSDGFLELGNDLMPTGQIIPVEGTVFDFKNGRKIAEGSKSDYKQNLLAGGGYDHPFVLSGERGGVVSLACPENGRVLEMETNQPAVVVYTSNQLEGDFVLNGGVKPEPYLAVCLETQKHPDAINHPEFPSVVLEKGEEYYSRTKYSFKTRSY